MNHNAQSKLICYMSEPISRLSDDQLDDYLWLAEQMLQEIRQQIVVHRNTPINTPTGSPEWLDVNPPAS